jgi:hypothetical protein
MAEIKHLIRKELNAGDAAVHGLYSGVLAGIAMAAYLVLVGLLLGDSPAVVLGHFDPNASASPLTGTVLHLATAGVYGLLYGLAWWLVFHRKPFSKLPGWLVGLAYGLLLYVIAEAILLPGASPLRETVTIHFLLAHLLYGLVLGLLNT